MRRAAFTVAVCCGCLVGGGVTEVSAGLRVADKSAGVTLAPSQCKQV